MAILKSLNDNQREAVLYTQGPLLIIAGAGSGKTRVMTHRIAYLIKEKNVHPSKILAVTFTNKAADEMKKRIFKLAGNMAREMWIGTFHSICGRILRKDIHRLGMEKNFVIFDMDDQKALMKEVLKELDLDDKRYKANAMLETVSRAKNQLINFETFRNKASDIWEEKAADCYALYQKKLKENNALDFDDMLMLTAQLFDENVSIKKHYQERFSYINVDEYQDTNYAQYYITRQLAGGNGNICVVGDDDQSIYAFRGADVTNILNFESDNTNAKVVKLEENYRSTKNILDAANSVIANNIRRKEKKLWTNNLNGEKVTVFEGTSEKSEAAFIVNEIKKLTGSKDLDKAAILYRANAQSRIIEEALMSEGMPYKIIRGTRFYERKEIKDLMAILRIIFNPNDKLSTLRAFGFMLEGIGKITIKKIESFAEKNGLSILDSLKDDRALDLPKKTKETIGTFIKKISDFSESSKELSASQLIQKIIDEAGFVKDLEEEGTVESISRAENVREFLSVAKEFEKNSDEPTLEAFLTRMALVSDQDSTDDQKKRVTLMTLHSAKGLEFPYVFICGMEEGIFPHHRSMFEPKELEEERRLCYVGITRAKERLYLCYARERLIFGESWCNGPSRFIEEIPEEFINKVGFEEDNTDKKTCITINFENMYSLGDMVSHPKWGAGEVVRIDGNGEDIEIDVAFANRGKKTLMLKYAPIRKS